MALYNKYRPEKFTDFIGNQSTIEALKTMVTENIEKAPSVFIISGESGLGKTTLARILAKSFNCLFLKVQKEIPCLECRGCLAPIIELDAGSMNIDSIRDILEESELYPMGLLKNRVYIVDEVHQLSTVSFNAMLKTLEKGIKTCKFILCTTAASKIPETILSRGVRFHMELPSSQHLEKLLRDIIYKENLDIVEEAIFKLSNLRNIRQMLSNLEVLSNLSYENQLNYLNTVGNMDYDLWSQIISGNCKIIDLLKVIKSTNSYYSYCLLVHTFLRKQMGFQNVYDLNNIKLIKTFGLITNLLSKGNIITEEQFETTIFKIGAINMKDTEQKHSEILFNLTRWGYFNLASKYKENIEDIYLTVDNTVICSDIKFASTINIVLSEIKKYEF